MGGSVFDPLKYPPIAVFRTLRYNPICNYTPLTQSEAAIPLHKRSGGARDFLLRFSPSPKAKRLGAGVPSALGRDEG